MKVIDVISRSIPGAADPLASPYFICRNGVFTRILAVTFQVTTDATVANRQHGILVSDSERTQSLWLMNQVQAATLTYTKSFQLGLSFETINGSYQGATIPEHLLKGEWRARVVATANSAAGDRILAVTWTYEEWG